MANSCDCLLCTHQTRLVKYKSIAINGIELAHSDNLSCDGKASFCSPFNKIDITMTPTECSLSYYEVRVTRVEEAYDINVGNLAYWDTSIALNENRSFSINIDPTVFKLNDGETSACFRLSFHAKSSIDGS